MIGIIPGSGAVISSLHRLRHREGFSKHPEKFGHGAVGGVAGPEAANNADSTGALVPMLALGTSPGRSPRS